MEANIKIISKEKSWNNVRLENKTLKRRFIIVMSVNKTNSETLESRKGR